VQKDNGEFSSEDDSEFYFRFVNKSGLFKTHMSSKFPAAIFKSDDDGEYIDVQDTKLTFEQKGNMSLLKYNELVLAHYDYGYTPARFKHFPKVIAQLPTLSKSATKEQERKEKPTRSAPREKSAVGNTKIIDKVPDKLTQALQELRAAIEKAKPQKSNELIRLVNQITGYCNMYYKPNMNKRMAKEVIRPKINQSVEQLKPLLKDELTVRLFFQCLLVTLVTLGMLPIYNRVKFGRFFPNQSEKMLVEVGKQVEVSFATGI